MPELRALRDGLHRTDWLEPERLVRVILTGDLRIIVISHYQHPERVTYRSINQSVERTEEEPNAFRVWVSHENCREDDRGTKDIRDYG